MTQHRDPEPKVNGAQSLDFKARSKDGLRRGWNNLKWSLWEMLHISIPNSYLIKTLSKTSAKL